MTPGTVVAGKKSKSKESSQKGRGKPVKAATGPYPSSLVAGGPGSGRHADYAKVAQSHGFTQHPETSWSKTLDRIGYSHPAGHSLDIKRDGSGAKLYTQHPTNPDRFSSTGKQFSSPQKLDNHLTRMSVA